jgi:hypothetical protein
LPGRPGNSTFVLVAAGRSDNFLSSESNKCRKPLAMKANCDTKNKMKVQLIGISSRIRSSEIDFSFVNATIIPMSPKKAEEKMKKTINYNSIEIFVSYV